MMEDKSVWAKVKGLDRSVTKDTVWLVLYAVVGALVPFFIAWIVKAMVTVSLPSVLAFTHAGEFALYAASVLGSTVYLLWQDTRKVPFPDRPGWSLVAMTLMGLSIVFYMMAAPGVLPPSMKTIESKNVFGAVTIGTFTCSVILYLVVAFIDATRAATDPRDLENEQVLTMTRRVRDLPG